MEQNKETLAVQPETTTQTNTVENSNEPLRSPSEEAYHKHLEEQAKASKFQREEMYKREISNSAEDRAAKFANSVLGEFGSFFRRVFGGSYVPQNDFSYTQKQQILGYLYEKNNLDMSKKSHFTYLNYESVATEDEIKKRLEHLEQMRQYNRMFMISDLCQAQNRIRLTGHLAGILLSACLFNIRPRMSNVRKLAIGGFFFHIGGQIASYRSIDRVFDGLYPIFNEDLAKHLEEEAKEDSKNALTDNSKGPAIESMLNKMSKSKSKLQDSYFEKDL